MVKAPLIWIFVANLIGLNAKVSIEEISEGPCWTPEPPPQIEFDYTWMFQFMTEAKYTPMASEYYYVFIHSMLTGSEPESMSSMDKMCLEVEAGLILHAKGYAEKSFQMECGILSLSALRCSLPDDTKNATSLYLTFSESKKYIIFATCTPAGLKAWTLMSSEKKVDDATKKKVLDHVQTLGFDPKKAMTMDYASCA